MLGEPGYYGRLGFERLARLAGAASTRCRRRRSGSIASATGPVAANRNCALSSGIRRALVGQCGCGRFGAGPAGSIDGGPGGPWQRAAKDGLVQAPAAAREDVPAGAAHAVAGLLSFRQGQWLDDRRPHRLHGPVRAVPVPDLPRGTGWLPRPGCRGRQLGPARPRTAARRCQPALQAGDRRGAPGAARRPDDLRHPGHLVGLVLGAGGTAPCAQPRLRRGRPAVVLAHPARKPAADRARGHRGDRA